MKEDKDKDALSIDAALIKQGLKVLKTIDSKKRQKVIKLLHQHSRLNVKQLQTKLKWPQPIVSQQMGRLSKQNLVKEKEKVPRFFTL